MKAIIVCNGSITDYDYYNKYFNDAELIIGVDGGVNHLEKLGKNPHVILGDFDSISPQKLESYKNTGIEVLKFPAQKDMTDSELAADYAVDRGYNTLVFIGAVGSRLDHSLANILMLRKLINRGATGIIANEQNEITLIKDNIRIEREEGAKITLLPLTEKVHGVSTKGLYYPLDKATIEMGSTWGVSNEFTDDIAEVTLDKGLLLVIKSKE